MTKIEVRTEKVAAMLAKENGKPESMRELFLGESYNLLYFGDTKKFERLEKEYDQAHKKKKKAS